LVHNHKKFPLRILNLMDNWLKQQNL